MIRLSKNRAFSLIELSIVLVILGLLTGGILAGKSLIRASELRSVGTEMQRIKAAGGAFRDKYFGLPGDLINATSFWGSLGGTGSNAACQNLPATSGTATCNGNGNGQIMTSAVAADEVYRLWQHLANAGLIEGQYTGVTAGSPSIVPGTNILASKLSPQGWLLQWAGPQLGNVSIYAGDYGNMMFLRSSNMSVAVAGSLALMPEEAWNIDSKMDDGNPATGIIVPVKGNATNTNCTTAANVGPPGDAGSTYALTNTSKDCSIYYLRVM
jgi:prepilin-type N-terminal cleavage/methylation domain-containing protein